MRGLGGWTRHRRRTGRVRGGCGMNRPDGLCCDDEFGAAVRSSAGVPQLTGRIGASRTRLRRSAARRPHQTAKPVDIRPCSWRVQHPLRHNGFSCRRVDHEEGGARNGCSSATLAPGFLRTRAPSTDRLDQRVQQPVLAMASNANLLLTGSFDLARADELRKPGSGTTTTQRREKRGEQCDRCLHLRRRCRPRYKDRPIGRTRPS
jgi:hypothetical protein